MKTKAFALALALTFIGVTASAYAADVTAPVAPAKPAASARRRSWSRTTAAGATRAISCFASC